MSAQLAASDHYALLGVARDATAADLKKAYRRLARTHHPDVNDSPQAADTFALVGDAFRVLSNERTRAEYDRSLARAAAPADASASPQGRSGPNARGADLHAQAAVPFTDAATGATCDLTLRYPQPCSPCGGTGYDRGAARMTCPSCDSLGMDAATGATCPQCGGIGSVTDRLCPICAGSKASTTTSTTTVALPAGLREGQRLRLARQGAPGTGAGGPGDLYVTVTLTEHPMFKTVPGRPYDVGLALPVTYAELALGAQIPVPAPGGGVATFTLPAGTVPNSVVPLSGHGLPGPDGQRGDLLIWVNMVMAPTPSTAHRAALQDLHAADRAHWDPRDGIFAKARTA